MDLFTNVPYRFYIFEDYSETESAIICQVHHAFCDGVSAIGCFAAMDSRKNFKNLP